jgi:hypothetical protein
MNNDTTDREFTDWIDKLHRTCNVQAMSLAIYATWIRDRSFRPSYFRGAPSTYEQIRDWVKGYGVTVAKPEKTLTKKSIKSYVPTPGLS